jgi:hypothetical protein
MTYSIHDAATVLFESGQVVELRCPNTRKGTLSGYFDDLGQLAETAEELSGKVNGVYVTLNPVDPALLARAYNRIEPYAKFAASDSNILRRRWLPLDFDAVRPAGISSTDEEHEAAHIRALDCREWMTKQGWPLPVYADSGNGAHLLYRVDMGNDGGALETLKQIVSRVADRFTDAVVKVDATTVNAARIWRMYGTTSCKGDPLPDRPHRLSRILELP